ncbi:hypothetical protein D3C72_2388160 [compost metagenome]
MLRAAGAQAHAVLPDPASVQAIGDNVLDPSRRADCADAGFRQAGAIAQAVQDIWR